MAWHTDLIVVKRSHHGFDPFPDKDRVLPFGSGAAIFWNYVDLQIYNPSNHEYPIVIYFTDKELRGEIRTCTKPIFAYHIHERNHKFTKVANEVYRSNEIWRTVSKRGVDGLSQEDVCNQLMVKNYAKVKYKLL